MVNTTGFFYQDLLEIAHYVSVRISPSKRDLTPKHNSEGYRGVVCVRIPLYSITDWHRSPISDSHPFDQPGT
ncbi:hypothetical protein ACSD2Y_005141 [Escherichia coli]